MPRPRHDSEVLPAKERLENAFWELLADRDYRKITVTDVVSEAGVNRNSFYYHFSGCRNWPIPPFCIRSNPSRSTAPPTRTATPRSSGANASPPHSPTRNSASVSTDWLCWPARTARWN